MAMIYTEGHIEEDGAPVRLLHEPNGDRYWEHCAKHEATRMNELVAVWWIKHLPSMSSVYNDGTLPPTTESKGVRRVLVVTEPVAVLTDEEQEAISVVHDRT